MSNEEVEVRAAELARQCEIDSELLEEDPVTRGDVRRAAADDLALRAGILHAPGVLPKVLADFLVRTWQVHVETFGRTRMLSELEIAAGWARRHAAVACDVLAMSAPLPEASSEASQEGPS